MRGAGRGAREVRQIGALSRDPLAPGGATWFGGRMIRTLLILLLSAALLLPKASATLAVLMPGSYTALVICTGSELVQIVLGPDGAPVGEGEVHGLHCLADATTGFTKRDMPAPARAQFTEQSVPAPHPAPGAPQVEALASRGGAPPRAAHIPHMSLA